jgi:hypothetical protein
MPPAAIEEFRAQLAGLCFDDQQSLRLAGPVQADRAAIVPSGGSATMASEGVANFAAGRSASDAAGRSAHVAEGPDSRAEFGTRAGSGAPHTPPDALAISPESLAIDMLRALELLKSAACAAQARLAVGLDESRRAAQAAAGVPAARRGLGVASEIALARRESPHQGRVHLGVAKALAGEMPHTLAALSSGALTEWRATLLVRETACLQPEHRAPVDEQLCSDPRSLDAIGDRSLVGAAMALDPRAVVERARRAVSERSVSCRPAPDTMVYLTGLLPVAQGVAVYAALSKEADRLRAGGDRRGRGQVMADTLVERVTGQARADAVGVSVQLIMTDRALFQGDAEPAHLVGYGTVPAQWARDLVRPPSPPGEASEHPEGSKHLPAPAGPECAGDSGACTPDSKPRMPDTTPEVVVWLRRLYTAPTTGELQAMDSRARVFPEGMRRFVAARDTSCRTPWCDAPIRHHDHVVASSAGGATSVDNADGLCEACNYAKEASGWSSAPTPAGPAARHTVTTTTPTGHRYSPTAPPPPGTPAAPRLSGELVLHSGRGRRTFLLQHLRG